jgi:RND family efflux transporter MFP subunit
MTNSHISSCATYLITLILVCSSPSSTLAASSPQKTSTPAATTAQSDAEREAPEGTKGDQSEEQTAVIAPWRSAEISAEARGIVDAFNFKEGDFVEKDQVVVVISKKRYTLAVQRAANAVKAAEADQKRARQESQLKEQLLSEKAVTHGDVLKAKSDEEVTAFRLEEAKIALEVARLDLESCQVKAPFSGYVALRFKEPFESVDYSQKLFVLVDTSKVYAIAGVPEPYLSHFPKGDRAKFVLSTGREKPFVGTVERIGKLLDSKSWTRKVYVVIDNPDGKLEVGMTGYLEPAK